MQIDMVSQAYDELVALNLAPSIRKIRERIGHGSMGDINRLLNQVKEERTVEAAAAAALPDHIAQRAERFMLQLWAVLRAESEEQVKLATAAAEKKVQEAEQTLDGTLAEADQMQLEIDRLKVRVEELQSELQFERTLLVDRNRDLAVAEGRLVDHARRAAVLQRSLDLALSGDKPARPELPTVEEATAAQVMNVFQVVASNLREGVALNEGNLGELQGLVNESTVVVSMSVDALVDAGLLVRDATGGLALPVEQALPSKSRVKPMSSRGGNT